MLPENSERPRLNTYNICRKETESTASDEKLLQSKIAISTQPV
jgi:hypothetical protein